MYEQRTPVLPVRYVPLRGDRQGSAPAPDRYQGQRLAGLSTREQQTRRVMQKHKVPASAAAYGSATASGSAAGYGSANPLPPPLLRGELFGGRADTGHLSHPKYCLSLGPHSRVLLGR